MIPATRQLTPARSADSGQAIVEAAIVLPGLIFLVLGILQLTMVQHARIMTEYAAFCAARAGIVYNADPAAMTRAAELALLPTMTRVDSLATWEAAAVTTIAKETGERARFSLPVVSVTTLNPTAASFGSAITRHLAGAELDFDDIRSVAVQANILQIKLNYYYKMKIPFANQMLQTIFFAEVGNVGAFFQSPTSGLSPAEGEGTLMNQVQTGAAQGGFTSGGVLLTPKAPALVTAARANFFYFPLQATYSMRMQSNIYASSVAGAAP